ncbi:MAG: hypothetical protein ACLFM6_01430 [Spirochaetaceae bacterium]
MSRRLRTVILALLLVVAYVFAFPRSTDREPMLERRWVVDVAEAADGGSVSHGPDDVQDSGLIPFELGDQFGYLSTDGRLAHLETVRYGLTASKEYFSNFSVINENIVLQGPDGGLVRSIPAPGYPYISGDRIYVFAPDGSRVSEWTADGEERWSRDFVSAVTDLDAGPRHTVVGLVDGRVRLIDSEGNEIYTYHPEQPRIPVALSAALSADEEHLAAVVGVDPQKLVLIARHSEGYFPDVEVRLESDFRRPVLLEFIGGGRLLAAEQPEALLVYDAETQALVRVVLEGAPLAVEYMPEHRAVVVLARGQLRAVVPEAGPLFTEALDGEDFSLRVDNGHIYLGVDGRIACVELSRG